jgi:L-seryl-tRNA(Ser) seleniumtransferase
MKDLSAIPSVDRIITDSQVQPLLLEFGRSLTLAAIREVLDVIRTGREDASPDTGTIIRRVQAQLIQWTALPLRPVINASGVILHTNLGRAPLSEDALAAITRTASGYSNLEFDLASGQRGSRHTLISDALIRLSGAEDALVVNNNASALLLALSALARRKPAIIARSQMVEIGGGFRIPEIMQQSGAKLVEVGTTNQVHPADYAAALEAGARVVLRVHSSNFKIIGYTGEPGLAEICALAHSAGAIVIDDLGSGTFLDTAAFGLAHEPMVQESIAAGADLVCFSGDKLLGGPQAGIITGRADLVARLKKHPLARAVRADKLCLAGLSATLRHYLMDQALTAIPVWKMISAAPEDIRTRAERWQRELGTGEVCAGESTVGGGSLPGETLPTYTLCLTIRHSEKIVKTLREQALPVIARIENDRVLLDPRTVLPGQDDDLIQSIQHCL